MSLCTRAQGKRPGAAAALILALALSALAPGAPALRAQTPSPSVPPPAREPDTTARPPAGSEPEAPAPEPAARRKKDRFIPSEEVSPDNDVPFPVDI